MIVKLNLSSEEANFLKNRYGSCAAGIHELINAEQFSGTEAVQLDLGLSDFDELEDAAAAADMSPQRYAEIIVEAHLSMRRRMVLWSNLE